VTPLRQRFIDDLRLRNYAQRTIETYVYHVTRFAKHFSRSPDQLGAEHVRDFQLHLLSQRASWSQFNQAVCAWRFFFATTCGQPDLVRQVPYGKRPRTLPAVLSTADTHRRLDAFGHPPTRRLFRTIYACGLRISEAIHLRVSDIDSSRMLVHIRQGKGAKHRCVPLSTRLLQELRAYWQRYRPADLLFPGQTPSGALCAGSLQRHCVKARLRAGLQVRVTPHTLRHCYATHLLEAGVDLPTLQRLLGHNNLQTTSHYLHVRSDRLARQSSPYDLLTTPDAQPADASRATANPTAAAAAGRTGAPLRAGVPAAAPVAD